MRHRRLAPGGRIVHADRVIAFVDTVEAIGGADAGADLVLPPVHQQAADMRIGDVRARHADHVELARGDRVPRGRHVLDARGMKHREPRRVAHLAGKIEMRRGAHALDRDHPGKCRVGIHMAANDIQKIHLPRRHHALRDLDALRAREANIPVLVGDHADADNETRAGRGAHRISTGG